jgi:nitrogen fixation/metabolism regulation signal transduction histidine kinase
LFKLDSLERFLTVKLVFFALPNFIFLGMLTWQMGFSWQWLIVTEFFLLLFVIWFIAMIKFRVMRSYTRAALHLDAIRQEDYYQFAKSPFNSGKVKQLHQQLVQLSEYLQDKKSHYDQHMFLLYQLIEQLDSPVLIFNKKQQLSFGNKAFFHLFEKPWQLLRNATPELLGLVYHQGEWQFTSASLNSKWQVRYSEFIDDGEVQQLLVFINIESALRASQLSAWQQIIRVLGHEIRNSLTPVSSMAESLAEKTLVDRDKKILNTITDRCLHLQSFVSRYAAINQDIQLSCQWLAVSGLCQAVEKLFTQIHFTVNAETDQLWADLSFIEQVLINLVKNAVEANASNITLNFSQQQQHFIIDVIDDGHGFANMDNLFVPLYTTKQHGQGIGLNFCRNVIEQHHGVLEITNNESLGVTAMIILPTPEMSNE